MRDFWRRLSRPISLPFFDTAQRTFLSFSPGGKVVFLFFAALCTVSSVGLVYMLNDALLVTIPSYGGSLTEGIIGTPRFINPVLAISDPDHDLTALTYSGLLRAMPDGTYAPDLAQSYTISSDGLTYTVALRPNATFSDGTPVTADDVVFTIEKTQDPALKSPLAANWNGVTVTEPNPETVVFTLKQPYAPFIDNLTLGILPKHLWNNVTDDEFPFSNLNINPVGSGPFRVTSINQSADGIPSSYSLSPFNNYTLGKPYLSNITLKFYQSEAAVESALKGGAIDAAGGLSPEDLSTLPGIPLRSAPLSRIYAVFFNQSQSPVLQDKTVREALLTAIDKPDLITQVLGGYGTPINGPLPSDVDPTTVQSPAVSIASARQMLLDAGWKPNASGVLEKTTGIGKSATTETLSFSLTTDDTPELNATAQYLSSAWNQMGASVGVKVFSEGDLAQNVIAPRAYSALLFGEVIGRQPDLYAFWSSSERTNPGLNIAMYANTTADKILNQLRQTSNPTTQKNLYAQLDTQLQNDIPALFLYAPDYLYSVPNDVAGVNLGTIALPSDRFLSVRQWYIETDRVWPFFALHIPTTTSQ